MSIEKTKLPQEIEKRIRNRKEEMDKTIQPIEILIDLVGKGELDPWNLDIIAVADKFLSRVEAIEKEDLRVSANTLLCASILLRKKSDSLIREEFDEVDEEEDIGDNEEHVVEEDWTPEPYDMSKKTPELRFPARRKSKRSPTLVELIEELQNAINKKERKKERTKLKKEKRNRNEDTVKNLAHEENIEEKIDEMRDVLRQKFRNKSRVNFRDLVHLWTRSEVVSQFIPLIFLSHRGRINLEQNEFFGEIIIKPGLKDV